MTNTLFRREAIEHSRMRLLGDVMVVSPPSARVYTWALCVGIGLIVAMLVLADFARRQRVVGLVALDPGVTRIYAPVMGEVLAVHARERALVRRGDPLVTLAVSTGRGAGGEGVSGQIDSLGDQIAALQTQQQLAVTLSDRQLAALRQQRSSLAATVSSLERQRGLLGRQVQIAQSDFERSQRLLRSGAGTERQVEDSQATLIDRRNSVEQLEARIIETRQAIQAAEAQIGQQSVQSEEARSQIGQRQAELAERRAQVLRQDKLVLPAPFDGQVAGMEAQVGQRVQPDVALTGLLPRGSRLIVQLYAPSRSAGFVEPGQEVRLMFDAFPYAKFGVGKGRVIRISKIPLEPQQVSPGLQITEPVYKITVGLEGDTIRDGARRYSLLPGMTLSANLVLERRRLWEVFFEPLLRLSRT